jgi:hypothetical protein
MRTTNSFALLIFIAILGVGVALAYGMYGTSITGESISIVAGACVIALVVAFGIRIANQWDRAVILRLGRFHALKGPRLFFIIPVIDGAFIMCDYSLHLVASRPARVGDKLVSTQFCNSVTRGFAAIGEPNVAVCLLPGTEVVFERDVECGAAFRLFRNRSLRQKVARFRQLNLDQPTAHHDALEFPDGKIALVTDLCEGQHATVLQLPAQPTIAAEANAEKRIAYVE